MKSGRRVFMLSRFSERTSSSTLRISYGKYGIPLRSYAKKTGGVFTEQQLEEEQVLKADEYRQRETREDHLEGDNLPPPEANTLLDLTPQIEDLAMKNVETMREIPKEAAIVFWDIKSMGPTNEHITEIGAYEVLRGHKFHSLIRPENITNGIEAKILSDQPLFVEAGKNFLTWLNQQGEEIHLISKSSLFNERLFREESQKASLTIPDRWRFHSLTEIAQQYLPSQPSIEEKLSISGETTTGDQEEGTLVSLLKIERLVAKRALIDAETECLTALKMTDNPDSKNPAENLYNFLQFSTRLKAHTTYEAMIST